MLLSLGIGVYFYLDMHTHSVDSNQLTDVKHQATVTAKLKY
jgi:hypothetical protein